MVLKHLWKTIKEYTMLTKVVIAENKKEFIISGLSSAIVSITFNVVLLLIEYNIL